MSNNWQEIIKEISETQKEEKSKGHSVWFRGQRKSCWFLESRLHRQIRKDIFKKFKIQFDKNDAIKLLREQFKSLYYHYKVNGWDILNLKEQIEWEIVFTMQHYGVPTPLLDWTESFACALYFTNYKRDENEEAAIFILKPEKLNKQAIGINGLISLGEKANEQCPVRTDFYLPTFLRPPEELPTIAVTPYKTNPRMISQMATFTICGNSFNPLEEEYEGAIKKIPLPADTFQDSVEFIDLIGITHFGYFPDLEGLKKDIEQYVNWQIKHVEKIRSNSP